MRLAQIQQQEPGGLYQPPVTIRDLLDAAGCPEASVSDLLWLAQHGLRVWAASESAHPLASQFGPRNRRDLDRVGTVLAGLILDHPRCSPEVVGALAGNFFLGPAARRLATQHPACPSYLLALTQLAEPT